MEVGLINPQSCTCGQKQILTGFSQYHDLNEFRLLHFNFHKRKRYNGRWNAFKLGFGKLDIQKIFRLYPIGNG